MGIKLTITASLMLLSCGSAEGAREGADSAPETPTVSVDGKPQPTVASALAVKELPYCDMDDNGKLVYVLPTKVFKTCDGTTGEWLAVDIKGEKGDSGAKGDQGTSGLPGQNGSDGKDGQAGIDGQAGEAGRDGSAGQDGTDGIAGQDGKDGTPGNVNMWLNPVTNKWWVRGNVGVTWAEANAACSGVYRLPSAGELSTSRALGLCTSGPTCNVPWWTDTVDTLYNMGNNPPTIESGTDARVVCVEI